MADEYFDHLMRNFPSGFKNTGGWEYHWAGEIFLDRFDFALGRWVRWDGYTPPPPEIDDIVGMDNP